MSEIEKELEEKAIDQKPVEKKSKTPKQHSESQKQISELKHQLEAAGKQLEEAKSKLSKEHDDYLRLMAEFQTFRSRTAEEKLALKAAQMVPYDKILIVYDRALLDDKAYITDQQFQETLAYFGKTEEEVLSGYDAVLHLVTCAKGAEYAYNFGNAARYESVEEARRMDDRTLRAWSAHPRLYVIDNSVDFEEKINRAIAQIYRIVGQSAPAAAKRMLTLRHSRRQKILLPFLAM